MQVYYVYKYASTQVCKYAHMQMQVCKYTCMLYASVQYASSMPVCKYVSMQVASIEMGKIKNGVKTKSGEN